MYDDTIVTYFAETDARNKRVRFGIKAKDRTKHVYVIGKTGMGKSTVLENMAVQDIQNGEGMAFIDPHGKTADLLLDYIPEHRKKDVVYFAPFDLDYPISFNVLEQVDPDKRHLVVSGLMSTFKKIWQDAWSARMEYILANTLLALLEYPGATLLGVNRMYSDKPFRKEVIEHITDPTVKKFWAEEYAGYTERYAGEATPAIQNKIGQFTSNALIRNMIGQPKSSFDLRKIIDEKKILIINLSKGRVGESNANLLGGMLITKIYLAAMSRADASPALMRTLPQFYLYVDEFQSFANESFADILSEARKYKLNLTMAHQYIEQMEEEVRAAVFGNVGTMIVFRVGAYDAEVLEKEFAPTFTAEDIVNLGVYQIYLKLMIDGVSSQPFSATTLPPIALPPVSPAEEVKTLSRQQFAHTRSEVEKAIVEAMSPIKAAPAAPSAPPRPVAPAFIPSKKGQIQPSSVQRTYQPQPPRQSAPVKPYAAAPKPVQPKPPASMPQGAAQEAVQAVLAGAGISQPVSAQDGTHKPFAAALRTMEKDALPARVSEIEGDVKADIPGVTLVREPQAKKTIPLASLSPAVAKKVASPEHKSDLKAALAKAMGKPVESEKLKVESGKSDASVKETPQTAGRGQSEFLARDSRAPGQNISVGAPAAFENESTQPPEVPADVLKKTLNGE